MIRRQLLFAPKDCVCNQSVNMDIGVFANHSTFRNEQPTSIMTPARLLLILVPVGVAIALLGLAVTIFGQAGVRSIVKKSLVVEQYPPSKTFANWVSVPLPIYNYFYLFNITNVEELLVQSVVPNVQEIGPFVFREHRNKINYTFEDDGNKVHYNQTRTFEFMEEMSLPLDTEIYHLNVPLISAAEFARSQGDEFYYYVVTQLYSKTNSSLYPKHTARELLFDGYEDTILSEGQGLIQIPYDKFGWFYGKNGTSTDGMYVTSTGKSGISSLGRLLEWNNQKELPFEGKCGSLADVSTGELYPPFPDPMYDEIRLFVGDICRPLTLTSADQVTHSGVSSQRFKVNESIFDYSLEKNKCFCVGEDGKCPANGVANVSACVFNTPAAISLPHFMYADRVYTQRVTGFQPKPSIHTFYMDIVPELGAPVSIQAAMQINIVLTRDERMNFTTLSKEEETYYPVFYFITNATISDELAGSIRLLQRFDSAIPYVGISIMVISMASISFVLIRFRKDVPCLWHHHKSSEQKSLVAKDVD